LDGSGICSWDCLHQIGREQDRRWQTYLDALAADALAARGLTREPG